MSFANNGSFGNGFNATNPAFPNFEFPSGSRTEHLFQGGLWVGGIVPDVADSVRVSTAFSFAAFNPGSFENQEFAPSFEPGDSVKFRSNLITDTKFFSPDAVSEQDLVMDFADNVFIPATTGINRHVPLGLSVHAEIFNSSFPQVAQIKFLTYEITNVNEEQELKDVYVGLLYEPHVGNLKFLGGGFFFFDDVEGYVDSLFTGYEYDADGDLGLATTYFGMAVLGVGFPNTEENVPIPVPEDTGFPEISVFWNYYNFGDPGDPVNPLPDDDAQRYARLSCTPDPATGIPTCKTESFETTDDNTENMSRESNRIQILSCGPFARLAPGESIRVFFAAMGAFGKGDLVFQAQRAREVFESNFAVPSPPPSPLLAVVPGNHSVTLFWNDTPISVVDPFTNLMDFEGFRVLRSQTNNPADFSIIAQFDLVDNLGPDFGLPPRNSEGLFEFIDNGVSNGFELFYAVTSFDKGDSAIVSLESGITQNVVSVFPGSPPNVELLERVRVVPNPYRGRSLFDGINERDKRINFTNLPARSILRIYTLTGDLIETIKHESDFVGDEPWDMITAEDQGIAAGIYVYLVTDEETGKSQTGKFVIQK